MHINKSLQMVSMRITGIAVLGMCCFAFAGESTKAHSKDIGKKELPAAVLTSYEQAYPNAKIKEIKKTSDTAGVELYVIQFKYSGTKMEADYSADGSLTQTKADVAIKSLPEAITKGVMDRYAHPKLVSANKVVTGSVTVYEVKVKIPEEKGKLTLDTAGTILESNSKFE